MAAITVRTNPHGAGWTANNFEDNGAGLSQATDSGTDADGTFDTALVETNSASSTTATVAKVTLDGGLEAASEIWLRYDIIDANTFRYVKLKLQSLTLFADVKNDEVELWNVVGGVHALVPPDTTTRRLGLSPGDLRHYLMEIRAATGLYPTISITASMDQHIVKISAKDSIDDHARDTYDRMILKATSTRNAAIWTTGGKVGVRLIGGTHSNVVRQFQAMLMDAWYADPVNGNDANAGSWQAAKKSWGGQGNQSLTGLLDVVRENDIGFIRGGTLTESIVNTAGYPAAYSVINFPTAQTSFEDSPFVTTYGNEVLHWRTQHGGGNLEIKGSVNWITLSGKINIDARSAAPDNFENGYCVKLWGQSVGGSGITSKHWRFQDIELSNSGESCMLLNHGIFSGTITPNDYEQWHELLDLDVHGARDLPATTQGSHGLYLEPSYTLVEYSLLHDNEGNGMKFSYGTPSGFNGVKLTNHNIARFNYAYDNWHWGFLTYAGKDNKLDYNQARHCAWKVTGNHGLGVYEGAETTHVRHNVAWNCGHEIAGQTNANFGCTIGGGASASIPGPIYFDNNTAFGGRGYNFSIVKVQSSSILGPVHLTNSVFGSPEVADLNLDLNATLATNENNWWSTDPAPKWKNPVLTANADFQLEDDSPLVNAGQDFAWSSVIDHRRLPIPQNVSRTIGAYDVENPLPVELVVTVNPTHAGSILTDISMMPVVGDPGNRGMKLFVKAPNGIVTATPVGNATVRGGG